MLDPALRDRLLTHIGLDAAPARPDADGLRGVHRAFLSRVPYEALAVQLGEAAPLAVEPLVRRVVDGGRGGYCFEINTVLHALLESLGFAVERRQAIVGEREAHAAGEPTNHLALVVTTRDGGTFLADAGWGEGPLDPVPLRDGAFVAGPFEWTVQRDGDGWWIAQHEWGSTPGFRFGDEPCALDAFAAHHERLSTSPESSFVQTLVVQRPHADRITTLRARTLTAHGPQVDERRTLTDADDLAATLRDAFGIDAGVLGPARIDRLWAQACAQHDAWLSAGARSARRPGPAPAPPAGTPSA